MSIAQQENSDRDDHPVDVYLKVVDRNTRKILFDSVSNFPSSYGVIKSFLKDHSKDFSDYSGYAGDISSLSSDLSGGKVAAASPRPRYTSGSVISSIPGDSAPVSLPTRDGRTSTVSTISSLSQEVKRQNRNSEPLLTSTKVDENIMNENVNASLVSDSKSSQSSLLSNGELLADMPVAGVLSADSSETSTEPEIKVEPNVKMEINGDIAPAPAPRGRKRRKNSKNSESGDEKRNVTEQAVQAKRPKKVSEIFDSTSNEESSMTVDTSSSERADEIIPKTENGNNNVQFLESPACGSREMNEEESARLHGSLTLWGQIGIGEWVFARWRDKNYYSGVITDKGDNDTWRIHFEDNMDDVASETHILPIKIIGKDVKAVYSPDNVYKPHLATVVGQLFSGDKDRAEYAIKSDTLPLTIICQRKQLSIKESEAKELRKQLAASVPKAADISYNNIVVGPRRRAVATTPVVTPQPNKRKIVGGAFDSSSADDSVLRDSATPATAKKPPKAPKATSTSTSTDLDSSVSNDFMTPVASKSISATPASAKSVTTATPASTKSVSATPVSTKSVVNATPVSTKSVSATPTPASTVIANATPAPVKSVSATPASSAKIVNATPVSSKSAAPTPASAKSTNATPVSTKKAHSDTPAPKKVKDTSVSAKKVHEAPTATARKMQESPAFAKSITAASTLPKKVNDTSASGKGGSATVKHTLASKSINATPVSSKSATSTPVSSKSANATPVSSKSAATSPAKTAKAKDSANKEKDSTKEATKESSKKSNKSKDKDKVFDGYQFFLTASGGGDPASSDVPPALPYDKDEYRDSIEKAGGKVVDSVGREKGRDKVFLISDNYARTVKYIYCVAAGIPCVSHQWILKCLDTNTIVDWKEYELKSGFSLESEQIIPAHQKKPLKNLKIFVTAETDELYNYWKPVLTAAEANLLKPKKKGSGAGIVPPEAEVVVTDSSCSQEVHDKVMTNNIPMVKPEWLVQTIITGRRASYSGHERYRISLGGEYEDE